ncbi:voltage-dependent calcium channel subunit alpha-2/delta-4-like [Diaphorina citri]|uniref:Voltage-dependent calcium channel subunit alpha-2/delta-4-like n=1 Tax=Diaphorina citri TaxID=121845 RepID=A0A1S3CZH7_DIACI|nr:voltage-dependent calcium channel subunit alpha-2/delta-4-like [Diaphorina citri]
MVAEEVLRVAKWSEALNDIFVSNYQADPSLSWQVFGSTTGALRVFPAHQWTDFLDLFKPEGRTDNMTDLYDCRVREWYINAAASPKDMVILLDNSGSMMGQRREIARHVINNLLDTLGNNDYVNVLQFTSVCKEVVPCFADILVQANLANVRELKMGVEMIGDANNIANFTVALTRAFNILENARNDKKTGADCNQAIMVVTDGASENYKEVFEEFNWRGQNDSTLWPVRVFSYLVGKEVADYRDVKWMACANKGYYVHLSTLAEVRDQILSYVPVMARPLVLQRNDHPIVWTPIYADVTDPKLSDWLWELKECEEQRERSVSFRANKIAFRNATQLKKRAERIIRRSYDQNSLRVSPYRLLTTVAMPAFDRRPRIVPCYKVCAKHKSFLPFQEPKVRNAFSKEEEEKQVSVANLLGVAAIDVPDTEFKRALLPHELGVNAYGFIVTNNGFILVHPDLRSMFQGILKPSYNSVDLTDIEQVDDDNGPRNYTKKLLDMRADIVNQEKSKMELPVKYQMDDMVCILSSCFILGYTLVT